MARTIDPSNPGYLCRIVQGKQYGVDDPRGRAGNIYWIYQQEGKRTKINLHTTSKREARRLRDLTGQRTRWSGKHAHLLRLARLGREAQRRLAALRWGPDEPTMRQMWALYERRGGDPDHAEAWREWRRWRPLLYRWPRDVTPDVAAVYRARLTEMYGKREAAAHCSALRAIWRTVDPHYPPPF
jgi:hypothetical protein